MNFKTAMVKSGKKSQEESYPQLVLTSTYNSFRLNNKALRALEVSKGDRVVMYDMGTAAPDADSRFFISAGFENSKGDTTGAKITGVSNGFNYSGVYGAMLVNDDETMDITPAGLIAKDLLYDKDEDSNGQYVARRVATAELVPYNGGEPVEVDDNVFVKLFAVTNIEFTEHTKREIGVSEEDQD